MDALEVVRIRFILSARTVADCSRNKPSSSCPLRRLSWPTTPILADEGDLGDTEAEVSFVPFDSVQDEADDEDGVGSDDDCLEQDDTGEEGLGEVALKGIEWEGWACGCGCW